MRDLKELIVFLETKMSMSELYQPAIILFLLEQGGEAYRDELARVLSGYDETVLDYYRRIVMRWPKRTLEKHQILQYDKRHQTFSLNFDVSDPSLTELAKRICVEKIQQWIQKRSDSEPGEGINASMRYRVLKAAMGKCELCGISSKITPIDIDHIVPRNKADKYGFVIKDKTRMHIDDERNLQALCFRCNRAKRDNDATDFRLNPHKLIRDRIPAIIQESGRVPVTQQVTGKRLLELLMEKLIEEHAELIEHPSVDEIIDMIEVLLELSGLLGYSEEETYDHLHKKRMTHGRFQSGTVLVSVDAT